MKGVRLGVAGIGLIGGSIALRARRLGARITGFDADPAALREARARGAVDDVAADLASLARSSDVLVIALPVDATVKALQTLAPPDRDVDAWPSLIVDVASVKTAVGAAAGDVPHFVATHPLAGRERGGIGAADAALFAGRTWAYIPPGDAALETRVRAFIAAMEAEAVAVTAADHDAIVALTSHLPQALSVILGAALAEAVHEDPRVADLCGPGMLSMLRLARSPESVWRPIVAENAAPIASRLRSFAGQLVATAERLERGDVSRLMSFFGDARRVAGALEERFAALTRS